MSGRAGYVLVGGKSSRFGRDKAFADVGGKPMARHVADIVGAATGDVFLVGDPNRYTQLALPVVPDQVLSFGPVAGIAAALEHSSAKWNVVVACDLPRLRTAFIEELLRVAEASDAPAVVPVQPDGRDQPLCAVYSLELRDSLREALRSGVRRVIDVIKPVGVRYVLPPEYAHIDPSGEVFANANTPADFNRAVRLPA